MFQTLDVRRMVVPDAGWLFQMQDVRMVAPDAGCQDGCSRHRMSGWLFQTQDVRRMVVPDAGC